MAGRLINGLSRPATCKPSSTLLERTTSTAGCSRRPFIAEDGHLTAAQSALASFNFSGGTLQADPTAGCYLAIPVTIGTAASSVATFDANGKSVDLNHNGACVFSGPGQLRIMTSIAGGSVTLGGSDSGGNVVGNYYTGGTTVLSGTLEVLSARPCPPQAF